MPTDEARRMLKFFGVAVTNYEDALNGDAPPEKLAEAESEVLERLHEVTDFIERLRTRRKS